MCEVLDKVTNVTSFLVASYRKQHAVSDQWSMKLPYTGPG